MSDRDDQNEPGLDGADLVRAGLNGADLVEPGLDGPGKIAERASAITKAGGLERALIEKILPSPVCVTLAEALVLGLLKQGVKKYLAIFGHGSTQIGEVLRVYEDAGLTRTFQFRNEVAMGTEHRCGCD